MHKNVPHSVRIAAPHPIAAAVQVLVFGLTFAAHSAQAQSQPTVAAESTLPSVKVTSASGYVVKNTSTATKTDTPVRDTPQSINVVSGEELRDRAVQSVQEAARYVPGVGFAQGEGNREAPIFRGFVTTSDFFVDGIRDDVQYYRDLYNIDRVEVFKGPNAMIFGRGATGGLINRVSKQPEWTPSYGGSLTLGSDSNKRVTVDVNRPVSEDVSVRVNAMYENSDSYRDGVKIERYGINPTASWRSGATTVTAGYEHFKDDRIADRGISSYLGAPVKTDPSTFFGNAEGSPTWSTLDAVTLLVEHEFANQLQLRNRTRFADQDKFYQNVFPGAVNAAGTEVAINAYNNATGRQSFFNQTDLNYTLTTGSIRHQLLAGLELSKQDTDNFRNTGYFPGNVTSVNVPLSNPTTNLPVTYRQAANDADNTSDTKTVGLYLQDQIELTREFRIIAGLRFDQIDVDFLNKRNGQAIQSSDNLWSPRIGAVYKPFEALSLYANYSVAYQPRAGEQLASLSVTNAALEPEKFNSYEVGAKWDVLPNLAASAAIFRIDRTNVIIPDPADTTRTILADGQRSDGFELGVTGRVTPAWTITGGYAYTDAKFLADTSATIKAGARVGQVPRHTLALWNRYDFTPAFGAGLGLIKRSAMYASNEQVPASNNVTLPGYTRIDSALFYRFDRAISFQLNVENLFDKAYYVNAHSNTNIMPGSPRAFRLAMNAQF